MTPTFTPVNIPINTALPPLPDFGDVLIYATGGGGVSEAQIFCQSNFPGQIPATAGMVSDHPQTAYLCFWGIPLDVPFQVELISPNNEIKLKGTFKALSATNEVAWSGHIPEEHDAMVETKNGVSSVSVSPWWPDELPEGKWQIHVTWIGGETYGIFDASTMTNSGSTPYIRATDPRIETEILPSGGLTGHLIHPGGAGKVVGGGFVKRSVVYLLVYADEQTGHYEPFWTRYVFVSGESVLTDNNGNFIANLPANLEQGRLYMVLGVTNPNAKLADDSDNINSQAIDAKDIFYIQPSASTFDVSQSSASCPGAPKQRMVVNQRGYVCTKGDNVRLKDAPASSASTVVSLKNGSQFTVIGGPACAENWSWWQIKTDAGNNGWISEGGDEVDPYFICPQP